MIKDEIIKLAHESGLANVLDEHASEYRDGYLGNSEYPELLAFAKLIAAYKTEVAIAAIAEAYRCGYTDGMEEAAVICENLPVQQDRDVRDECAAAIRERIDK